MSARESAQRLTEILISLGMGAVKRPTDEPPSEPIVRARDVWTPKGVRAGSAVAVRGADMSLVGSDARCLVVGDATGELLSTLFPRMSCQGTLL